MGYWGSPFAHLLDIKHPKMEIPLLALLFIGKSGAAGMVTGISAPLWIYIKNVRYLKDALSASASFLACS